MPIDFETTVGSIATEFPLSTRVFARHGIDFCCGGGRSLADACQAKGVETATVLAELKEEIEGSPAPQVRWDTAPLPDLIQHILTEYHEPLKQELARLEAMVLKVHRVHGDKDPERLQALVLTFDGLEGELLQHMAKEEQVLFPMILGGHGAMAGGPISVMEAEHDDAGAALRRIRELTDDYQPPAEACNTWRALWAGLADLERALHEHIHLENNVLHKRAVTG